MEGEFPNQMYESSSNFLFIGGISLEASARDVGQHFEQFGKVTKVDLPLTRAGLRKGFGFVHFLDSESLQKALSYKLHEIRGKRVAVRKGVNNQEASQATKSMQERKIYATGFPAWITEEEVYSIFAKYGKVARILSPRDGIRHRGFCYVIMKDVQDFEHLCSLGGITLQTFYITLMPAQIKSKVKDSCNKFGIYQNNSKSSSSSSSQRMVPMSKSGAEPAGKKQVSPNNFGRPCAFPSNLNHNFGDHLASQPVNYIGSENKRSNRNSGSSGSGSSAKTSWYSPFTGVAANSFYQFADKIKTKQNLAYLASSFLQGGNEDVEIEIVQDISTTITIRNPGGHTAIRATFEEQNTFSGIF